MEIIGYQKKYGKILCDIFYDSVLSIKDYYSQEQLKVWASLPKDYARFCKKFEESKPYIMIENNIIVAFIEFKKGSENTGYIDCFYVANNYQRKGIGSKLYSYVEDIAYENDIKKISVEASYVVMNLFKKFGYRVIRKNIFKKNGVELINFSMEKFL